MDRAGDDQGRQQRGLVSVRATVIVLLAALVVAGVALQLGYGSAIPETDSLTDRNLSPSLKLDETETERHVYELINAERTDRGLEPLEQTAELRWVARNHSEDMRERDFFAHENPDGIGPETRIEQGGVDCVTASENIIKLPRNNHEQELARTAVDAWLDSPGHLINLVKDEWERTGVGVDADGQTVYITQTFCE